MFCLGTEVEGIAALIKDLNTATVVTDAGETRAIGD